MLFRMNDIHVNISDGKIPRFLSLLETGSVIALVDSRPPAERNVKDNISRNDTYPKTINTAGFSIVLSTPSDRDLLVVKIDELEASYADTTQASLANHAEDYKLRTTAGAFSVVCVSKTSTPGFDICSGKNFSIDLASGYSESSSGQVRDVAIRMESFTIIPSDDGLASFIYQPNGDTAESDSNTVD